MKLKGYEIQELLKSPEALAVLIDYHSRQETMADGMDYADSALYHQRRREQLEAKRGEAEAERAKRK
jgi:hypothetical protein